MSERRIVSRERYEQDINPRDWVQFIKKVEGQNITIIGLGPNPDEIYSYLPIGPEEALVETTFTEKLVNWAFMRLGCSLPLGAKQLIVYNPRSPLEMRVIDHSANRFDKLSPLKELEGVLPDPEKGTPGDTPVILEQKRRAKELLTPKVMEMINNGEAVELLRKEEKGFYWLPITDELRDLAWIEGDSNSARFREPTNLFHIGKRPLKYLIVEADYSLGYPNLSFKSPGSGKARMVANNLFEWAPDGNLKLGKLPALREKNRRAYIGEVFLSLLVNANSALPVYPESLTIPEIRLPNPLEKLRTRLEQLPPNLQQEMLEWCEAKQKEFFQHRPMPSNTEKLIDYLISIGLSEKEIAVVITSKPEERMRLINTIVLLKQGFNEEVKARLRNAGAAILGEEKARAVAARLTVAGENYCQNLPLEEMYQVAITYAPENKRQRYTEMFSRLNKQGDSLGTRKQFARMWTSNRLEEILIGIGRRNYEKMSPQTIVNYENIARITRSPETTLLHPVAMAISEAIQDLPGEDTHIREIRTANFYNLRPKETLRLSLQFCPLYVDDPRPLNEYADMMRELTGTEKDILRSAVGPKWIATKAVLETLQKVLGEFGMDLEVHATFGDMGAVVSKREWADPEILRIHGKIYEEHFTKFCEERGIELTFDRLSDYSQEHLPETHRVPQYVVVEEGRVLDKKPSVEELLEMLGIRQFFDLNNKIHRKKAETLMRRLEMSDLNFDLTRVFVHTYVTLISMLTEGADVQLGMELAEIYLALTTAIPESRQAKMPAINVLAK